MAAPMRMPPQRLTRLNRVSPLAHGLSLVALPAISPTIDSVARTLTATGTRPSPTPLCPALGFGATKGVATTDKVVTSYSGVTLTERTYFAVFRRDGAGGGNLGRILDKTNGSTGQILYWLDSSSAICYSTYAGGVERQTVIPGAGVAGTTYTLVVTHKQVGTTATINAWVNGVRQVVDTSHSGTINDASSTALCIGNRASDNARCWDGAIGAVWVWDRALSPDEAVRLSANPWQLFNARVDPVDLYRPTTTRHTLVGSTTVQDNLSASGLILQYHKVLAAATQQANQSGAAAIVQKHVVIGSASVQQNQAAPGSITQHHKVLGAASQQDNLSPSGAVAQHHRLTAAVTTGTHLSGSGYIVQQHKLVGAGTVQENYSGVGAIGGGGPVYLVGAPSLQANLSGVGAIVQRHVLAGSGTQQANAAGTGPIGQRHSLTAAPTVQANTSPGYGVIQRHWLVGAGSTQANLSPSGSINSSYVPSQARTFAVRAVERGFTVPQRTRLFKV